MAKQTKHYKAPPTRLNREDFAALLMCQEREEGLTQSEIIRRGIRLYADRFANPTLEDIKTPAT
jgi:hypothetical protein